MTLLEHRPAWQPYPRIHHTLTAVTEALVNGTDAHPAINAYRIKEARWWGQERPVIGRHSAGFPHTMTAPRKAA